MFPTCKKNMTRRKLKVGLDREIFFSPFPFAPKPAVDSAKKNTQKKQKKQIQLLISALIS